MPDTITVEETRRLIKKLRARIFLTVTQADDLLRLCDGLDIAQEMQEHLHQQLRGYPPVAETLAEWDNWQKGIDKQQET